MIIGVDVGYTYTKYVTKNNRGIFRSTVSENDLDINNSIRVIYENQIYTIGEKGNFSVDFNKINDKTFKLCLYTALTLNTKDYNATFDIVTGLPIGYYSKQKNALRQSLENQNIFINNKLIKINRCIVFPQSAGIVVSNKLTGYNMVIDIGGMSVDISLFEDDKLISYASYPLGTLKLYANLIQDINKKNELGLDDVFDVENILKSNNKQVIYNPNILKSHYDNIINHVMLDFPQYKIAKKTYIGGGSLLFKDFIKDTIIDEPVYSNAKAFYKIGEIKYDN